MRTRHSASRALRTLAPRVRARHAALVLSREEIERRVRAGGHAPERWMIWKRHFEAGPPRKLVRLAREIDLADLRVLDLGCGHGSYLVHFSRASVGLDRRPERIEFARSLDLNAELRDVEAPGWQHGLARFDLVWVCDLLPHVADPARLLAELPELLAPGGRIAISEWIWPESERLSRLLAPLLPSGREALHAREHVQRVTPSALARWLADAGLAIEREWLHSVDSPLAARVLRRILPPRTMIVGLREARVDALGRAQPPRPAALADEKDTTDALPPYVLRPHRADPRLRELDLAGRRRGAGVDRRGNDSVPRSDSDRVDRSDSDRVDRTDSDRVDGRDSDSVHRTDVAHVDRRDADDERAGERDEAAGRRLREHHEER